MGDVVKNAAMNVLAKKASSPKHPLPTKTQSLDEMKQTVHEAQDFLRKGQQTTRELLALRVSTPMSIHHMHMDRDRKAARLDTLKRQYAYKKQMDKLNAQRHVGNTFVSPDDMLLTKEFKKFQIQKMFVEALKKSPVRRQVIQAVDVDVIARDPVPFNARAVWEARLGSGYEIIKPPTLNKTIEQAYSQGRAGIVFQWHSSLFRVQFGDPGGGKKTGKRTSKTSRHTSRHTSKSRPSTAVSMDEMEANEMSEWERKELKRIKNSNKSTAKLPTKTTMVNVLSGMENGIRRAMPKKAGGIRSAYPFNTYKYWTVAVDEFSPFQLPLDPYRYVQPPPDSPHHPTNRGALTVDTSAHMEGTDGQLKVWMVAPTSIVSRIACGHFNTPDEALYAACLEGELVAAFRLLYPQEQVTPKNKNGPTLPVGMSALDLKQWRRELKIACAEAAARSVEVTPRALSPKKHIGHERHKKKGLMKNDGDILDALINAAATVKSMQKKNVEKSRAAALAAAQMKEIRSDGLEKSKVERAIARVVTTFDAFDAPASASYQRPEDLRAPLHALCYADVNLGSVEKYARLMHMILDAKADVNVRDKAGGTPLYVAAQQGNVNMANILFDHGADPNLRKHWAFRVSPLFIAAKNGHHHMVKLLIDKKADINARRGDNGATAFWISASFGNVAVLKMLHAAGCDMSLSSFNGRNPLSIALMNTRMTAVDLMRTWGLKPDKFEEKEKARLEKERQEAELRQAKEEAERARLQAIAEEELAAARLRELNKGTPEEQAAWQAMIKKNQAIRRRMRKQPEKLAFLRAKMVAESYTFGGADVGMLFRYIDKDGSGEVDREEFVRAMRKKISDNDLSDKDLEAIFIMVDEDDSGEIDVYELAGWLGLEVKEDENVEDDREMRWENSREMKARTLKVSAENLTLSSPCKACCALGHPKLGKRPFQWAFRLDEGRDWISVGVAVQRTGRAGRKMLEVGQAHRAPDFYLWRCDANTFWANGQEATPPVERPLSEDEDTLLLQIQMLAAKAGRKERLLTSTKQRKATTALAKRLAEYNPGPQAMAIRQLIKQKGILPKSRPGEPPPPPFTPLCRPEKGDVIVVNYGGNATRTLGFAVCKRVGKEWKVFGGVATLAHLPSPADHALYPVINLGLKNRVTVVDVPKPMKSVSKDVYFERIRALAAT